MHSGIVTSPLRIRISRSHGCYEQTKTLRTTFDEQVKKKKKEKSVCELYGLNMTFYLQC